MRKIFILGFFLFTLSSLLAQEPDSARVDSTNTENILGTLELIRKSDSIRLADSLQKEFLQRQLQDLQSTETSKRKELENALAQISSKDSLNKSLLKAEIDSLKKASKGFPVIAYKDTLFYIYTKIGSVSPSERSKVVTTRLKTLYKGFLPQVDSIVISDYGQTVDMSWNGQTILSVTELDAMWYDREKLEIAQSLLPIIKADMDIYKKEQSWLSWAKDIGLMILVFLLQFGLVYVVNWAFRTKVNPYILEGKGTLFTGFKIKDFEVLDEDRLIHLLLVLSKAVRYFINAVQLYLTIPLLFSIFPPTRWIAETLFGYVLDPVKNTAVSFFNYIPDLITVIVIILITRYLLKFLLFLTEEISNENLKLSGFYPDWAKPTYNIVKVLVYAFMFVVIFPYLPGSNSPVFQGVSVFLGIIFSLGSSSVISNMVAGLVMTYMRPFQIGDRIKIGDIVGDVIERTPFVTRIKTPKQEYITVPNSNILSNNVVNYSTSKERDGIILHTTVTIGYDVPWRKVHEALIESALRTTDINNEPKPFVLQTSLDDFYVSYELNAYSDDPNEQAGIYSELHQHIQDVFFESDIEILSPHYRAARDGNMTTIPANYLPKDYVVPSFRVEHTHKSKKE
ncbi:MAG: mechanosensitive ion channel family protein [Flavobacteriales bacterium]|nr:mechanosensitive ion channel family protein [Flavobacteriales bacterium]